MELVYDAFKDIHNDKQIIFNTIYPFATENINDYTKYFDLKDKSLLTVGSSGDQAINALLEGSKDVTVLDICPYTEMYYYLKIAGILALDKDEFMNFFSTHICYGRNPYSFNFETYNSIEDSLRHVSNEGYEFWDALFNKYPGHVIRTHLFTNDEHSKNSVIRYNNYLANDENYEEARKLVMHSKVKFINDSIDKFKSDDKFDNIWLSNIAAYLSLIDIRDMFLNFLPYLNNEGKMLLAYIYHVCDGYTNINPHYSNNKAEDLYELLKDYEFVQKEFEGVQSISYGKKNSIDKILTYKKGIN